MKKLYVIMAAALLMSVTASAQQSKFAIMPKAGLSFSHFSVASVQNKDYRKELRDGREEFVGFNVGVVGEYNINKNMTVQLGLEFADYGDKFEGEPNGIEVDRKITVFALNINPNFVYKMHFGIFSPFVQVGPYLRVGLGGRFVIDNDDIGNTCISGISTTITTPIYGDSSDSADLNRTDFGFNFGLGCEFQQRYVLSLNYNLGVTNLMKDAEGDIPKCQVRMFSVNFGYRFNLGK